jgi:nicotinate-nucleotide pyrophosphorylase (carboxylating)
VNNPRGKLDLKIGRELDRRLREALAEDIGPGDVTTERIVPRSMQGRGELIAKADGIFCGGPVADRIWNLLSRRVRIAWKTREGGAVEPGQIVMRMEGPYWALLEGERVALNFMQRLSGVATLTRRIVDAAGGRSGPAICDTRKTTPLWRELERYAVRAGGGKNHRFGLFDMVLIKENHARAAGNLTEAVRRAKSSGPRLKIAAEARNEEEVREAIEAGAGLILLDNMKPAEIRRIVRRYRGAGVPFEVSGGVNLANVASFAKTGVERISIGALTHSAPALDLSLQLYPQ